MDLLSTLNFWVALGAVVLQIATIVLIAAYFMPRSGVAIRAGKLIDSYGLWILFALTLFATVMSLLYSEYLGIEPCPLCWWQRIFLYPQVILLGMAAWKKDSYIAEYSIVLSFLGGCVALYHHLLQMFGEGSLPCPATGVSCAQRFLFEFGYVTYPLVALSLFAFMIVTMFFVRSRRTA